MGNTSSSGRITAQDRAILDMKLQRDKLRIYQKKIQTVLDAENNAAKVCLQRGDKPRALLALRRRKYQETLLQQTDRQLETLEQLTSSIEFALVEKDVLFGLRQGNAVLKEIHKEMTLESVQKLMDETAEGIQYQKEINNMLVNVMSNADEDEVEDELERMEREVRGEALDAIGPQRAPDLPSVPNTTLEPKAMAEEKARKAKARARARKAEIQRAVEEPMVA
ncbi:Snf7-domain-containing protein [Trichophaea hybrida]|nr:Snf7-domain-containing protein [Trichophaea hybrida]